MAYNTYFQKRHLILNIIHHLGPISRTELIALTDYRPASITDIIKELLAEELIVENGFSSTGHGRKRAMLEINREKICAIGMSFSSGSVTLIVSRIDGILLHQSSIEHDPDTRKETLVDLITDQVSQLLSAYQDRLIVGIGISDPQYDPTSYHPGHSLMSNYTHFNDWIHFNLVPKLKHISGLPVENYSGVAMPVMAEQRFGVAKGAQNFLCVELSNGIGASICCNGMPVVGAHGRASELGHMVIDYTQDGKTLCYCGKTGCVESTTAYPALMSHIAGALKQGVFSTLNTYPDCAEQIPLKAIRRALDEGDKMCMYYVKESAWRLGIAISNAVNLLNPELIVLHGFMLELGEYFITQLTASIRENTLSLVNDFEIRISDSTESMYSLGAVAEIFSSYLKQNNFTWVYQLTPQDLIPERLKTQEFNGSR